MFKTNQKEIGLIFSHAASSFLSSTWTYTSTGITFIRTRFNPPILNASERFDIVLKTLVLLKVKTDQLFATREALF